jgi:hypothetical protein
MNFDDQRIESTVMGKWLSDASCMGIRVEA